MSATAPTISIRLPEAQRQQLDRAAKQTRRSRSFLMQEALERHLADIVKEETVETRKRNLATLLSFAGAGAKGRKPRTAAEVDTHIRWLRDNE
jgi:RHH-type transcriptional regulator, rel operon repressor / antitoxin RelB